VEAASARDGMDQNDELTMKSGPKALDAADGD
jgi:hypothetical protein